VDDLYAYNFKGTGKTGGVASLLSNIMLKGLDSDHQHGVELPSAYDDDEDDEGNEDDEGKKDEKMIFDGEESRTKGGKSPQSISRQTYGGEVLNFNEDKLADVKSSTLPDNFETPQAEDKSTIFFNGEEDTFIAKKKIGKEQKFDSEFETAEYSTVAFESLDEFKNDAESKTWEYLTGVSVKSEESEASEEDFGVGDIFAYRSLVCVPSAVLYSSSWKENQKFMCINNCSSNWEAELFWVDPSSSLISRGRIRNHDSLIDRTSENHVWVVVLYHVENIEKSSRSPSRTKSRGGDAVDDDFININLDDPEPHVFKGPTALVLRASISCFSESSMVVMTWTPWVSYNIARRVKAVPSPPRRDTLRSRLSEQQPNILLNIFDIPKRKVKLDNA
jgi:hypothetical protein